MLITPTQTVDLQHRAYHLSQGCGVLAVSSSDDQISIIDDDANIRQLAGGWGKIHSISFHPDRELLAISHRDRLTITDLDGKSLFTEVAPWGGGEQSDWLGCGFNDSFFDADGRLWCVAPLSKDQIEIQLREPEGWSITQRLVINDPFGFSSCSFHTTCDPDSVALWVAAGQDGQQVIWVSRGEPLFDQEEQELVNTTPPVFSLQGDRFMVCDEDWAIRIFSYPDVRSLGSCTVPDEESGSCYSMGYVGERTALVGTESGRTFLLDVAEMNTLTEVEIAGHPPRPTEDVYPTLKGDQSICTDLLFFRVFGDRVVMVYRRDRGVGVEGWKDTLAVFSAEQFVPPESGQLGFDFKS